MYGINTTNMLNHCSVIQRLSCEWSKTVIVTVTTVTKMLFIHAIKLFLIAFFTVDISFVTLKTLKFRSLTQIFRRTFLCCAFTGIGRISYVQIRTIRTMSGSRFMNRRLLIVGGALAGSAALGIGGTVWLHGHKPVNDSWKQVSRSFVIICFALFAYNITGSSTQK